MLAAVYNGNGTLELRDLPQPQPGPNEVLIRVEAAAICTTDLHILQGAVRARPDVVIGHEFAGVVEKIGSSITTLAEGDHVTVDPHVPCGKCRYCRTGDQVRCKNLRSYGMNLPGGYAQNAVICEQNAVRIPAGISMEEAALTENVGCCVHCIERARIQIGDVVAVFGGGFVGMLMCALASRQGASQVILVEPLAHRRSRGSHFGVTTAIDPNSQSAYDQIMELSGGFGADVVIEASGVTAAAEESFKVAGKGGKIVLFGILPRDAILNISPFMICMRELEIIGANGNVFSHQRGAQMLRQLNFSELITHKLPLARIHEGLAITARQEAFKVCVLPQLGD